MCNQNQFRSIPNESSVHSIHNTISISLCSTNLIFDISFVSNYAMLLCTWWSCVVPSRNKLYRDCANTLMALCHTSSGIMIFDCDHWTISWKPTMPSYTVQRITIFHKLTYDVHVRVIQKNKRFYFLSGQSLILFLNVKKNNSCQVMKILKKNRGCYQRSKFCMRNLGDFWSNHR